MLHKLFVLPVVIYLHDKFLLLLLQLVATCLAMPTTIEKVALVDILTTNSVVASTYACMYERM